MPQTAEKLKTLETIKSFVPVIFQRRLEEDPAFTTKPDLKSLEAAILFVDISGFTNLTEAFAKEGVAGLETITDALNEYFRQLIKIISEHGGDIVQFSGDALLSIWPTEYFKEDSAKVSIRAAQCALDIVRRLAYYEVNDKNSLSLRVSIGLGEISFVRLGGVNNIWHTLVAGTPLEQLNIAHQQTEPGSTTVSLQGWSKLEPFAVGTQMLSGAVSLEKLNDRIAPRQLETPNLEVQALTALESSLPAGVKERIRNGQVDWLGEVRRVSTLFIKLPDLNYATPLGRSQECMRAIQSSVFSHSGVINKISVDEKGANVVVVFGMPPLSSWDDPVRAVRAAISLQAELRGLGLRSSIGISTGQAFCGWVGSNLRREYTLVGDVINLAARLMQSAADEVLCDFATYKLAQETILFERLSSINVKGKKESLPVFRPKISEDTEIRREFWIIDRIHQRTRIREALLKLSNSSLGETLIFQGEAGIGKSLLVQFAALEALNYGLKPLQGIGSGIEREIPYLPWRSIFISLLKLHGNLSPNEKADVVRAAIKSSKRDPDLAPLLNNIFEMNLQDSELTGAMTGKVRGDNTSDLLLSLFMHFANTPLLLIFEDLHWFDQSSLALIEAVRQNMAALLLIGTTRPLPGEVPRLYSLPSSEIIKLDPLDKDDASALVCRKLGVGFIPDYIQKSIMQRANGHPLFTEQLACALRDTGFIALKDGHAHVDDNKEEFKKMELPENVHAVIRSRIDRLGSTNQQLLLKVASVVGKSFDLDLLFDIFPIKVDREVLRSDVSLLESEGFIVRDRENAKPTYGFKHDLIREVTYSSMLKSQKQKLHDCVARWYEQKQRGKVAGDWAVMAYHWENAEEESKARRYLNRAAEAALREGIFTEAVAYYKKLIAMGENSTAPLTKLKKGRWHRCLGEALLGLGKLSESRDEHAKAASLLGHGVPSKAWRLYASIANLMIRQLLRRTGILRGRIKRAKLRAMAKEAIPCHQNLLELSYFADDTVGLLYSTFAAAELGESINANVELAASFGVMADLWGTVGMHRLARFYLKMAKVRLGGIYDLSIRARVLKYMLVYYMGVGDWSGAEVAFKESLEIQERLGDKLQFAQIQGMWGQMNYWRGNFNECIRAHNDMIVIGEADKSEQTTTWGKTWKAIGHLRLGDIEEAVRLLDQTINSLVPGEDIGTILTVHGTLSACHAFSGEYEAAIASSERAVESVRGRTSSTFYSLDGYATVIQALFLVWERYQLQSNPRVEHVKKLTKEIIQSLKKFAANFPVAKAWYEHAHGTYSFLSGDTSKAEKAWQRCIYYSREYSMPYEEGLANLSLGKALPPSDRARNAYLKKALETFEKLGSVYEVRLIKALKSGA